MAFSCRGSWRDWRQVEFGPKTFLWEVNSLLLQRVALSVSPQRGSVASKGLGALEVSRSQVSSSWTCDCDKVKVKGQRGSFCWCGLDFQLSLYKEGLNKKNKRRTSFSKRTPTCCQRSFFTDGLKLTLIVVSAGGLVWFFLLHWVSSSGDRTLRCWFMMPIVRFLLHSL